MEGKTTKLEREFRTLQGCFFQRLLAFFLALAFVFAPCSFAPCAYGADETKVMDLSAATLEHKPPVIKDIVPGKEIVLLAYLKNTRQTEARLRCLLVKDGRLMELPLFRSYRNEYDIPTYEFKLQAPLVEATYHFVLYKGAGLPVVSARYALRRACLPRVELTDLNPANQEQDINLQLPRLLEQARGLEKDLTDYEQASELIEELKQLIAE